MSLTLTYLMLNKQPTKPLTPPPTHRLATLTYLGHELTVKIPTPLRFGDDEYDRAVGAAVTEALRNHYDLNN